MRKKKSGSKNRPNDGAFYSAWHYINSDPHHMTLGLFESQDAILLHILFSDYCLIYSFFDKPIFPKHRNIGTVFLNTVMSSVKMLKSRNRIFGHLPTIAELISPPEEQESEDNLQGLNDNKIVAQVHYEKAVKQGEIVEIELEDKEDECYERTTRIVRHLFLRSDAA